MSKLAVPLANTRRTGVYFQMPLYECTFNRHPKSLYTCKSAPAVKLMYIQQISYNRLHMNLRSEKDHSFQQSTQFYSTYEVIFAISENNNFTTLYMYTTHISLIRKFTDRAKNRLKNRTSLCHNKTNKKYWTRF